MYFLAGAHFQEIPEQAEEFFKIRYGVFVRFVVIHSQSSAYVNVLQFYLPAYKPALYFVYPQAKRPESGKVSDLRADVKVYPDELNMVQLKCFVYYFLQFPEIDTEFILLQPGGYVFVGVRIDIRIDTQGDTGDLVFIFRQPIDHLYFLQAFAVE